MASHNDREEDQSGSPRESRVTVASGFEAVNMALSTDRIAHLFDGFHGGDEGTRTPDPLLAKEVLSQLSYIPTARASYPAPAQRSKLSEIPRFAHRAAAPGARHASEPPGRAPRTRRRARHGPARPRCAH